MNLLPDIDENGQLILEKEDRKLLTVVPTMRERRSTLKQRIEEIKARKVDEEIKRSEELNNDGHKEVTPDFEDSPHADRVPLVEENEEAEEEKEDEEE